MNDIVLFSDTSLSDIDFFEDSDGTSLADVIKEFPAKGAGVHRIKTEVRKSGFTCQVVDLFFYFTKDEILELCSKFITEKTLVVGFSTTFWSAIRQNTHKLTIFKTVLQYVRNLNGPKIILGGTLAEAFAASVTVDKVFNGFSEMEFIDYLYQLSGTTKTSDFNFIKSQITYNNQDCMDFNESPVIEISRGCIFKCAFCSYPLNGKSKFDYIKEQSTLEEELLRNFYEHGITTYTLSDDTFNDSMYKMEYLHKIFTSLPFKLKFVSYLRLDLLQAHREQINLLKEMGLIGAFFGIETLNHKSGTVIGKAMKPEVTKDLLYELKANYWKDSINVTIGLISGLPFETRKSHEDTLSWITDEKYCLVDRIRPAGLSIPNPLVDTYPFKSEFQLNAIKYGFYWPDATSRKWKNLSHEIKSQDMAISMAREIYTVSKSVNKTLKGNFGIPLSANIGKYGNDPKTIEEIVTMSSIDYNNWLSSNRTEMISGYVNNYKFKILNL